MSVSSGSSKGRGKGSHEDVREQLEQKFTEEYSKHVKEKSRMTSLKFGALTAGIGGVIGAAAAPVLIPGVAIAAVAGGAGGYQWARHWWTKPEKKHCAIDDTSRPSMRRLKFMVKWGQLQLLELEDSACETRCAVIDRVVSAFAPWVQKAYFLKARSGGTIVPEEQTDPETKDVFRHLSPLFHFLQNRASMEAVVQSAKAVEEAFNTDMADKDHEERCRVSFPTIMETISMLDRLSPSMQSQLQGLSRLAADDSVQRSRRRSRLQNIVTAVHHVLSREDVQKALANPQYFRQASPLPTSPEKRSEPRSPASSCESPRSPGLFLPPEGAENEEDEEHEVVLKASEDNAYYSLSSEEEGAQSRPRTVSIVKSTTSTSTADFHTRIRSFPRGDIDHTWNTSDATLCHVRSATYLTTRTKIPSGPAMLEFMNLDFFHIGEHGPTLLVSEHPDHFPVISRKAGDKRFFFVQNWVFPPFQAILTAALDPDAPWLKDPSSPLYRVWWRFLEDADNELRKKIFKMSFTVEKGPWLLRKALPPKPVRIGTKIKMETYYKAGDYMELVFDTSTGGSMDRKVVGMTITAMKSLQVVFNCMLEGHTEDQLPENVLFSATMMNVDPHALLTAA